MASRTLLLCAVGAVLIICCSAVPGSSYSSSSSSSSSSSGGNIYFGEPGQAQSFSGSFPSGGPGLVVRTGVIEPGSGGSGGSQGVFSSSSSKVDNDGRIHYNVQAGRF